MNISFPPILIKQQVKSEQQFFSQHAQHLDVLNAEQLNHFKNAITLSDFILKSAMQAPELVIAVFKQDYQNYLPDYKNLLTKQLSGCDSEEKLHRELRRFRLQYMVQIARDDLLFNIDLDTSLARLSLLADELICGSLAWLTVYCEKKWGVPKSSDGEQQPLLVYGMGKLGGKELNFSSDIDLIFTYPQSGNTSECRRSIDNQQFFTRLAQKLISSLHQVTADGFVYRVDMRLRPFGDSGPLVLTVSAMEDYYQEQGRDWERYAMLKARVIGDSKYNSQLSMLLRPFVYRRYIDFSVIDSLRRMKMMIAQEVRRKKLNQNIKLGAGGIREIEFIVQVFQLIRGGRVKALQQRSLLTVLPILVTSGEITPQTQIVLEAAYRFLRRVENIIQALSDQQTQTLPNNAVDQMRVLHVLQIDSWPNFLAILTRHMDAVHQEFDQLIGLDSPNYRAIDEHWVTLWHSRWDDDESIAWLNQEKSMWHSTEIWFVLNHFRQETDKRTLGMRGRQVLDKLIPSLLCRLQCHVDAVKVLTRVLHVFNKIITRTAYLELLFENDGALKQLIHLCEASSWVTEYIAKYPILLDELIDPKLLHSAPKLSSYPFELREYMLRIPEDDLEAQMESLRQFKQSQQLRIAATEISEVLPVEDVSQHLTALAEAILSEVVNLAWQQVRDRFGVPSSRQFIKDDNGFGIIAYGKTGGTELGYNSDLDLVFVHQCSLDEMTTGRSDGQKSVPATQFYLKLAQRILHIFNTRMNSGILYELDMRLRPSGNAGLLVVHLDTFAKYQHHDAWTWEHQALVRARMIYGNAQLRQNFIKIRQDILSKPRLIEPLKADVLAMREKMRRHLDTSDALNFDLKQGAGGLVDIEFLAQFLVLANAAKYPSLLGVSDNVGIYKALACQGLIDTSEQRLLTTSYHKQRALGHKAVMQNKAQLLAKTDINCTQEVCLIWHKYLS